MRKSDKLTVAIMQPHFIPYAGYLRLFAAADLFVVYDCVQFTRRGRIHRNQLPDRSGEARWLTLPLSKADRDVQIKDLSFTPDANEALCNQLTSFPCFDEKALDHELTKIILDVRSSPVDYILRVLEETCGLLKLPFQIIKSSSLDIDPNLRGQFRVLEILDQVNATHYVNSPAGRKLYDVEEFTARDIEIRFQNLFIGSNWSILQRILTEDVNKLGQEIRQQS